MSQFFTKEVAAAYDERNSKLSPIATNMHFLTGLVLKDVPEDARVLCVGVGTGAEIFSLAEEHPEWTFVGVDPSEAMITVCRERLEAAGLLGRCELMVGYVHDVPAEEDFDATLSILVGHFVPQSDRKDFYGGMHTRLKQGGYMVNTELSTDLGAETFAETLKNWEQVQLLMGATRESLHNLSQTLRNTLTVLPPADVEQHMRDAGFAQPIKFFQAFLISGWWARK